MALNRGAKAAEVSEEQDSAARKAAYASDRLDFLKLESGETAYVRMLTPAEGADGWIRVAVHAYVKTKPQPKNAKSWPKGMSALCRNDIQLADLFEGGCYVCDHKLPVANRNEFAKPTSRIYALAVMREQVRGDGSEEKGGEKQRGKVVGFTDVKETYELLGDDGKPSGRKAERLKLVIINMTWSQFYATLSHAEENYIGGSQGRDFMIKRVGEGTDTSYNVLAVDPLPELAPGTPAWKRYEDELASRKIDLEEIVLGWGSDAYIATWFDPTKTVDKDGNIVPASEEDRGSASVPASRAPADDASPETQERLADLRSRLTGNG